MEGYLQSGIARWWPMVQIWFEDNESTWQYDRISCKNSSLPSTLALVDFINKTRSIGQSPMWGAWPRKSEWKVNSGSRNSSPSNGSWATGEWLRKLYPRTMWRMDLRALRVGGYACYNFCVWGPKFTTSSGNNFYADTPTSPEVIGANTLNFKPNFKFPRSKVFGRTPSTFWFALSRLGQSLARIKIWGGSTP